MIVSQIVLDTLDELKMSYPETSEARRQELLTIRKGLEKQSAGSGSLVDARVTCRFAYARYLRAQFARFPVRYLRVKEQNRCTRSLLRFRAYLAPQLSQVSAR